MSDGMTGNELRRVVILATPGSALLDIAGPYEVFSVADRCFRERNRRSFYRLDVISTSEGEAIPTDGGLAVWATTTMSAIEPSIDTLVVAAGAGIEGPIRDAALLRWLGERSGRVRRVAAVCCGTFLLATAGLLRGRRATTHWSRTDDLARRFPETHVEHDPIFVSDHGVFTCAGRAASMDLALAFVEEDLGPQVAFRAARTLVMYVRRPANQPQLSAALDLQSADRRSIRDLQSWIVDHVSESLSISRLAHQAAMSERNFARVFAAQTGTTPARFVERVRVETARRRIEESDDTFGQIAQQSGFNGADSMRRAFLRVLKRNPSEFPRARNGLSL